MSRQHCDHQDNSYTKRGELADCGTLFNVTLEPNDDLCRVTISGNQYNADFNLGLDPVINQVIYNSLQTIKDACDKGYVEYPVNITKETPGKCSTCFENFADSVKYILNLGRRDEVQSPCTKKPVSSRVENCYSMRFPSPEDNREKRRSSAGSYYGKKLARFCPRLCRQNTRWRVTTNVYQAGESVRGKDSGDCEKKVVWGKSTIIGPKGIHKCSSKASFEECRFVKTGVSTQCWSEDIIGAQEPYPKNSCKCGEKIICGRKSALKKSSLPRSPSQLSYEERRFVRKELGIGVSTQYRNDDICTGVQYQKDSGDCGENKLVRKSYVECVSTQYRSDDFAPHREPDQSESKVTQTETAICKCNDMTEKKISDKKRYYVCDKDCNRDTVVETTKVEKVCRVCKDSANNKDGRKRLNTQDLVEGGGARDCNETSICAESTFYPNASLKQPTVPLYWNETESLQGRKSGRSPNEEGSSLPMERNTITQHRKHLVRDVNAQVVEEKIVYDGGRTKFCVCCKGDKDTCTNAVLESLNGVLRDVLEAAPETRIELSHGKAVTISPVRKDRESMSENQGPQSNRRVSKETEHLSNKSTRRSSEKPPSLKDSRRQSSGAKRSLFSRRSSRASRISKVMEKRGSSRNSNRGSKSVRKTSERPSRGSERHTRSLFSRRSSRAPKVTGFSEKPSGSLRASSRGSISPRLASETVPLESPEGINWSSKFASESSKSPRRGSEKVPLESPDGNRKSSRFARGGSVSTRRGSENVPLESPARKSSRFARGGSVSTKRESEKVPLESPEGNTWSSRFTRGSSVSSRRESQKVPLESPEGNNWSSRFTRGSSVSIRRESQKVPLESPEGNTWSSRFTRGSSVSLRRESQKVPLESPEGNNWSSRFTRGSSVSPRRESQKVPLESHEGNNWSSRFESRSFQPPGRGSENVPNPDGSRRSSRFASGDSISPRMSERPSYSLERSLFSNRSSRLSRALRRSKSHRASSLSNTSLKSSRSASRVSAVYWSGALPWEVLSLDKNVPSYYSSVNIVTSNKSVQKNNEYDKERKTLAFQDVFKHKEGNKKKCYFSKKERRHNDGQKGSDEKGTSTPSVFLKRYISELRKLEASVENNNDQSLESVFRTYSNPIMEYKGHCVEAGEKTVRVSSAEEIRESYKFSSRRRVSRKTKPGRLGTSSKANNSNTSHPNNSLSHFRTNVSAYHSRHVQSHPPFRTNVNDYHTRHVLPHPPFRTNVNSPEPRYLQPISPPRKKVNTFHIGRFQSRLPRETKRNPHLPRSFQSRSSFGLGGNTHPSSYSQPQLPLEPKVNAHHSRRVRTPLPFGKNAAVARSKAFPHSTFRKGRQTPRPWTSNPHSPEIFQTEDSTHFIDKVEVVEDSNITSLLGINRNINVDDKPEVSEVKCSSCSYVVLDKVEETMYAKLEERKHLMWNLWHHALGDNDFFSGNTCDIIHTICLTKSGYTPNIDAAEDKTDQKTLQTYSDLSLSPSESSSYEKLRMF